MPSLLTIRFDVQNGKTVSRLAVSKTGLIWLRNDHEDKEVTVTFGHPTPLCKGGEPQASVVIGPGGQEVFQVCDSVAYNQIFKYTAQFPDAKPEDPIVIVEPS